MGLRALASLALAAVVALPGTPAAAADPQAILHLLDYVGVDYAEAVAGGRVKNEDEYKEMLEFTAQAAAQLKALPPNPRQAALVAAGESLAGLVAAKADAAAVADAGAKLRWALIEAYGVRVAPQRTPDLAAGARLYAQHCATCHGAQGHGDGPAAKGLEPAPSDFHDAARMVQRSAYGLYNTITLGVAGTAMRAFKELSEGERWSLAFFVANLPGSPEARARGGALWGSGEAKSAFPDLGSVAALSADEVRARHGEQAMLVHAYLRAHPAALAAGKPAPLELAAARIRESVAAYRGGDRAGAQQLAVQAYLEGFELVEAGLQNVDADLVRETERQMMALRTLIRSGAPIEQVDDQAVRVEALLERARAALSSGSLSPRTVFASALLILLREGLEALLVVAAILAFLVKAGRCDALPYVHMGWIGAIVLGLLTWAAATELIAISGTNRELLEGITALVASAMLVYVGYWLHSKSSARAWQGFIKERVGAALADRTLWAMTLVAFLAVYREMFETVLFYQALWVQAGDAGRGAFLGGAGAAVAALAGIGWGISRYSVRLPLAPFFAATSILLCTLAVVLAGKGVAALQEAGAIPVDLVDIPAVPWLGIFPTWQTLGAQAMVAAAIVVGFLLTRRLNGGPA
jgi:high-affinity iron transporter